MKKFISRIALLGILALDGCISAHYDGKLYESTQQVTVYYSRSDLPEGSYETMGELKISADTVCSSEAIIKKIRETAMAKGADIAIAGWFDSCFQQEKHKHSKSCVSSHCHQQEKDKYRYKQLVKVTLLKIKTAK